MNNLPPISKEQINIINLLAKGNISVNAVAGSGKTTTSLYIAKSFKNWNILLLTYNARLKDETRKKVRMMDIRNMEIHSYHAFVQKYYYKCDKMTTDNEIIKLLRNNNEPLQFFKYDLIIIDEAQDMTNIYYNLINKIIEDNLNKSAQLCLVGDKRQCIYKDMKNANEKYLTNSNKWFPSSFEWKSATLSQSFRVPQVISNFVNDCMLKENVIFSSKKGYPLIDYIITNQFSEYLSVYNNVIQFLKKGYKRDDILILACSVKKSDKHKQGIENKPCLRLVNRLNEEGHYCWVANNDDDVINNNKEIQMKNKIAVLTFHQSKGLERKIVFVYDFSEAYFIYYNKNKNRYQCPNLLYVATTRALEKMILIHHFEHNYLPFLDKSKIKKYCNVIEDKKLDIKHVSSLITFEKSVSELITFEKSVSELISYLDSEKGYDYFEKLEKLINKLNENKNNFHLKNEIKEFDNENKELIYDVSTINGIAIPAYFEIKLMNSMGIWENILKSHKNNVKKYINDIFHLKINELTSYNILRVSAVWDFIIGSYNDKVEGIKNYNWLTDKQFNEGISRLSKLKISKNSKFEFPIECEFKLYNKEIIVKGAIDCIDYDNNIVYEFKCGNDFDNSHYLQLAIYAYMVNKKLNEKFKYYLFNIKTEELHEIIYDNNTIELIIYDILKYKCFNKFTIPESDIKDKIMVFDLETTSLYSNEAKIIEIAYILFTEDGKCVDKYSTLVKPDGFEITNSQFHGIEHSHASKNGIDLKDALLKFINDLSDVKTIVGHNIRTYDLKIIYKECEKIGEYEVIEKIKQIPTEDTLYMAKNKYKIENGYKLEYLYQYLFNEKFKEAHRALPDVEACAKCYFKMKDNFDMQLQNKKINEIEKKLQEIMLLVEKISAFQSS